MKTRLAKFISDSGGASRREAERLIENGSVSVNGKPVTTPVFFVEPNDVVAINNEPVRTRTRTQIIAFNKPANTMTTLRDPDGRKTIYDCLPKNMRGLKYVGRLDYKTTGLLLLTNDGDIARRLTLPESKIVRVYTAKLRPDPGAAKSPNGVRRLREFLSPLSADDSVFDSLRRGATIDGVKYAPMEIELLSRYPLLVKIKLTEGKKNEIRIAFDYIGLPVSKLNRESYGPIELGNLESGKFRELTGKELTQLTAKSC
ncbi:MAG: rRNA pseudouridine synthase [Alphaproteobacteria bacterium]|nr:rRNA pseudouridine synthase [Alphaproteobacteria bacterium]MCL2757866.1 rRNA pseudouridine synthase [Alphaproteobacteria bacterium]